MVNSVEKECTAGAEEINMQGTGKMEKEQD
jgi:hypothetical protein